MINNDQLRLTEIQNGNVDLMRAPTSLLSTITEEGGLALQQSMDLEAERYDTFNSSFIGFNTEELDRPLRRAISRALDRSELVNVITYGAGQPTLGTVPRGMDYPVLTPENWRDLGMARELVQKSSYTPDQSSPVELLVHGQKNTRRLGELVSQQLSEVGIEMTLDIQQASSYWDNTYRYEQSLVAYGGAADVDPWMSDFKQLGMPDQETGEGAWQRSLYFDEEFSELLHEANASPDLEERAGVYEDIVEKFVEDAPFAMTTFPLNPKAFAGVTGVGVQAGLSNFHSASLEE